MPVTFETAVAELAKLPRMYVEPDGSFVWTSPPEVYPPWQVDGTLVDGGATLFYCELKGYCPSEPLDQLLACLSDETSKLVFEEVERGVVIAEEEFRRSLTSLPDAPAAAPDRQA